MKTHWIESLKMEHTNTASEESPILSQVWGTDLVLCYSKGGRVPPGHLLARQTLGPTTDLMNQNPHVNKVIRWSSSPRTHSSYAFFPSFHGRKSKPGKLKDSGHTGKECLVEDTHPARPHRLKTFYPITVCFWAAVKAFVLLCLNIKEALPL